MKSSIVTDGLNHVETYYTDKVIVCQISSSSRLILQRAQTTRYAVLVTFAIRLQNSQVHRADSPVFRIDDASCQFNSG